MVDANKMIRDGVSAAETPTAGPRPTPWRGRGLEMEFNHTGNNAISRVHRKKPRYMQVTGRG